MIIRDSVVRRCIDGPRNEARAASTRVGVDSAGEPTGIVVILNRTAVVALLDCLSVAVTGTKPGGVELTQDEKDGLKDFAKTIVHSVRDAIVE